MPAAFLWTPGLDRLSTLCCFPFANQVGFMLMIPVRFMTLNHRAREDQMPHRMINKGDPFS
jgi:hypothetical protein